MGFSPTVREMTSRGKAARRVTLTFDNGPTPDVTECVLDVLAAARHPRPPGT